MTFLTPWAFAFLAMVPVIVLLYLLKVRRRAVTVSTLLFWQELIEQSKRRALFQRLRNLLSLLLHLLIFLLILFALARPELKRFVFSGASTVLVIDGGARMQATDGGKRVFDAARELAAGYARHASSLDEIAVVFAHAAPEVAAPFSSDETALRRVLGNLEPTDAEGDLQPALDLARSLLEARKGESRVVVFTSRTLADAEPGVEVVRVGKPAGNTAITAFAARPLPSSPRTMEVLLELRNFGRERATGSAEVRLDGQVLDVRPYDLEAGGSSRTTFALAPEVAAAGRGWLTATLDHGGALATDDIARAALPPLRPIRVLLVTSGDWFLENLLKADDLVSYELLTPEGFQPSMAAAFDVVVLDGVAPEGLDPAQAESNLLHLGASPFPANGRVLDQPLITDADAGSPLLRLVNLKNVVFLRAQPVPPPDDAGPWTFGTPILSFDDPLVLTGVRRDGGRERRIAVFGFDTGDSDLPLRVAFPLLMSNTLRWLGGAAEALPRSARAGEVVELEPGERLASAPSNGDATEATVTGNFRPLRNGFYRLEDGDRISWLAVNTFSESESDLAGAEPSGGTGPEEERALSLPRVAFWPIWFYLALAALVLFTLEWFLYHRRKTE